MTAGAPSGTPGRGHSQNRDEWTAAVYDLLKDGKWHVREDIIRKVMPMIPPGVAWRKAEHDRLIGLKARKRKELSPEAYEEWVADPENLERKPGHGTDNSPEGIVRVGRRALARKATGVRSARGVAHETRIEMRTTEDGVQEIRLRPEAPRYAQSRARQLRAQWIKEHRGEVDEDEIRKYVHRVNAQIQRDRNRAKGLVRDGKTGRWYKPEA